MESDMSQDKWSRWLEQERWPEQRDPLQAALHSVRDRILELANLQSGEVVVDLGAGTGLLGLKASEFIGHNGLVLFLDISRDALQTAASSATTDRERFLVAGAENCPLADGSVNAVVMRSVLIYIPDRRAAALEIARILNPRGRVVAYEPINRRMAQIIDMSDFPDIDEAYQSAKDLNPLTNFDEDDLVDAFKQAGFISVEFEEGQSHFPVRGKEWAHGFKHGAPAGYSAYDMLLNSGIERQRVDEFVAVGERQLGDKWTTWSCPFVYLTAIR
jgi:arsenite methyltransferase